MGVYLSQPETSKSTHLQKLGNMTFCASQMQGWRKGMEDAAIHQLDIGDGNSLFAVFDGHGGPEVSRYVAQIFLTILKARPEYAAKKYVEALDITFKKIDEQILSAEGSSKLSQYRQGSPPDSKVSNGTGCTANVLLITSDKYIVANAGDSRSSLCRKGKAIDLSKDHKPQDQEQKNRIERAGGQIIMGRVNGGLNLTRSFGDFDYKKNSQLSYAEQMITCKPDILQVQRSSDDEFIVLGCDGICQGLIDLIKEDLKSKGQTELHTLTEGLLDHLLARDTSEGLGCDNMTAIILLLK